MNYHRLQTFWSLIKLGLKGYGPARISDINHVHINPAKPDLYLIADMYSQDTWGSPRPWYRRLVKYPEVLRKRSAIKKLIQDREDMCRKAYKGQKIK